MLQGRLLGHLFGWNLTAQCGVEERNPTAEEKNGTRREKQAPLHPPLAMIFGYSMGAMQAFHFAVRFPGTVRRLGLVCGAADPWAASKARGGSTGWAWSCPLLGSR